MCRIGIFAYGYNDSMTHGGIKTEIVEDPFQGYTLVHEWLPIQTDGTGHSIIKSGPDTILFNGELFGHNHKDDIELIRDIHQSEGVKGLIHYLYNEADGFWSIIIKTPFKVIAMTDPLGKKQLYYRSGFGIASEIKALRLSGDSEDKTHIANTIKFGYSTDDSTPWLNIKRLLPNRVYEFISLKVRNVSEPKFDFHDTIFSESFDFYELMDQAVKNRLAGHKEIGLLLSGGLDSSIIHYHLKKAGIKLESYCINHEEDLKYARMVDPEVNKLELVPSKIREAIKTMEYPMDLGSVLPQYQLMQSVQETVVLTGDGADELFGGYRRSLQYDSQYSDVFYELPFYHLIRLDRMAARFTKEIRSPFLNLNIVKFALQLDWKERGNKKFLREIYSEFLPKEIFDRPKEALKSEQVRTVDPIEYRVKILETFREEDNG